MYEHGDTRHWTAFLGIGWLLLFAGPYVRLYEDCLIRHLITHTHWVDFGILRRRLLGGTGAISSLDQGNYPASELLDHIE